MTTHYLACDLGAESGRLVHGTLENGRLALTEIHRWPNGPVKEGSSIHWDMAKLFAELQAGLAKAGKLGVPFSSISTDSWGVDYVLLDDQGALIPPAFHYRDPRTALGLKRVQARVAWPVIFAETGIQFMPINAIYQLMAENFHRLHDARRLLGVGDAFNHWLGGEPCMDQSLASTYQLYNP
nr:FGGY family carbohydrate kinase [Verrucomicrobiae bacterium]